MFLLERHHRSRRVTLLISFLASHVEQVHVETRAEAHKAQISGQFPSQISGERDSFKFALHVWRVWSTCTVINLCSAAPTEVTIPVIWIASPRASVGR